MPPTIIRDTFERIRSKFFGALGQYNLVKPVLVDHEGCILQLDINGNLLVAFASGAPGVYAEDSVAASGELGNLILAVQQNAIAATSADGQHAWLKVNSVGALYVQPVAGASGTVFAEDSPHVSGDLGYEMLSVRRDVPISSAGTDGDYATINTDSDGYLYARAKSYDSASNADRSFETAPVWSRNVATPVAIAAAQAVTVAWADLGPEIPLQGFTQIGLWLNITQNDSQNVRVRALLKHTSAGANEYPIPITSIDVTGPPFKLLVQGEYVEFDVDASQLIAMNFSVFNWAAFVQFQVMAEVAGATPASIVDAAVTYGYGG